VRHPTAQLCDASQSPKIHGHTACDRDGYWHSHGNCGLRVDFNEHVTDEALKELEKHIDMIECECPTYLIEILGRVRDFNKYTTECIQKYPKDAATHMWLSTSAKNIDAMLSNTIVQLARIEGFIDDKNEFKKRSREGSGQRGG